MQTYELTVVLPGKTTAAKKKATQEKIEKMVSTYKGKVGKVEDWGEKELSYKIKKNDSGIFVFFPLELEASAAKVLFDKIRLEEDIIRYLLIRV